MKEIFEIEEEITDKDGKKIKKFKEEKDKNKATHKHICYHDEANPGPCRRVKL